ncbi:hypothetical protein SI65_04639 [Aspergillus cristatus]|uniref:Uncharacterized protein n=1 Tax=Aspergillus cristatus TaxID=573508 RepID=A0A1E3BFC4_ASPCR|nr:hypothetical protein SI65_04639 [Aspergillus cristatus]
MATLISDNVVRKLWLKAQRKNTDEWASVALWNYIYNKHLFPGTGWVVTPEYPPSSGRRRVDITIRYITQQNTLATLAFPEAKDHAASPGQITDAESQALDACTAYLSMEGNEGLNLVYAITSYGTKAEV